jgi:hypothetical protein
MPRPRRSACLFLQVSAMSAATLRMEGRNGDAARLEMLHRLEDLYDDMGLCPTQSSVVGALAPDGLLVAVYYAPGDPRNTAVDFASYCLQHNIIARFRLVPASRESANDVVSPTAYLPAAARGRDVT